MYFCYTKLDYTKKAVSSVVGRRGQLHMQKKSTVSLVEALRLLNYSNV